MEPVVIHCGLGYDIDIGLDFTAQINSLIMGGNVFLITDRNVANLYKERIQINYNPDRSFIIKPGEFSKSLSSTEKICRKMFDSRCDRKTTVIALGGGVVGDLAGFVSSIYMRGVDYVQIPTTLLAMVDSSVGGKTAVDLDKYKNIIGSFKQPKRVILDLSFLKTMPLKQITSGLGEIAKTALLDAELFDFLGSNIINVVGRDGETLAHTIERCIRIKADVVTKDERETGLRRILNIGHTFGHGIETLYSCRDTHGEYVLSGLYYELRLAEILSVTESDYAKAIYRLLEKIQGTPIKLEKKNHERLVGIMLADKKNHDSRIAFVLPESKGKIKETSLTKEELLSQMKFI